jgi:hypothetical protein
MPSRDVLIDAVDQRAVEVEDKRRQRLGLLRLVHAEKVFFHVAVVFL